MLYLITFFMIIINLIYRDSKKVLVIDFIYFMIMLGFSYGSYDTMIFINRYLHPEKYERFTEKLFNFIVIAFNRMNFSYRTFMISTAFVELSMIFNFIKKYTLNYGYVVALFVIFPMILVFEQLRFLMAFTIVLRFGIENLIDKKKFYRIKFLICIGIASLIHSSVIFYLVFLIADFFGVKTLIKFTVIAIIVSFVITTNPQILRIIGYVIGSDKLEIVTRIQKGQEGQFGCSALSMLVFLEYFLYYYYATRRKKELGLCEKDIEFLTTVLKFNIISMISIPLIYVFSVAFMRIAVNLALINYVGISKSLGYNKKYCINKEKAQLFFIALVITIVLFFFASHTEEAFVLNVFPFFEENEIYKIFM